LSLIGAVAEDPSPVSRVYVEKNGSGGFPMQCRHCEDPYCVKACVAKALYRETADAPVQYDRARCIDCWMCAIACPFGVIGLKPAKCDLCAAREGGPACVSACKTGALCYADVDEYNHNKRRVYMGEMERRAVGE
jgi:carbon-monoxide dehydrogenase iron sulfur subunit